MLNVTITQPEHPENLTIKMGWGGPIKGFSHRNIPCLNVYRKSNLLESSVKQVKEFIVC